MPTVEVNFDGLVGPTHNYAGLSLGNVASMSHRGAISNPRAAVLQGLAKMKFLADLGVPQAILPPHPRPAMATLRALGFSGSDAAVLARAYRDAPELLRACCSASNMWVANAATIAPSPDTTDGRVHLTAANLVSKLHRSIEPPQTVSTLRAIFHDERHFAVHEPVPGAQGCGDEGAANHTRLAPTHEHGGLHLFVYGHHALAPQRAAPHPVRFPSRQAREASQAVARANALRTDRVLFAQQDPAAIDAGVFHNDVIAVGNEHVLLYHERAFCRPRQVLAELQRRYATLHRGRELTLVCVREKDVPLADAVRSYLFNSQLITLPDGTMALIAPIECRETPSVNAYLQRLLAAPDAPLRRVHFVDLRQSMRNGGGPACLRLRVVLTERERAALPPGVFVNEQRYAQLVRWANKHYREELRPADLADVSLLRETQRALDELTRLLGVGSIYPFQR